MVAKVVKKSDARVFLEGIEVCREYFKTDKLTFGTSTLLPGQRGSIDKGHEKSHEIFYCVSGTVIIRIANKDLSYELHEGDAILIPMSESHEIINIGREQAMLTWSLAPSEFQV